MIDIKCIDCKNCTGDSCKVYGSDEDKAVKSCADDSFKNYKPRMSREEAAEIIKIERKCVERNTSNECDRDCINCDLLRMDEEIFSAYDMAIALLQEPEIVYCKDCKLHNSCSTEYVFKFFRMENGFCAVGSRK